MVGTEAIDASGASLFLVRAQKIYHQTMPDKEMPKWRWPVDG